MTSNSPRRPGSESRKPLQFPLIPPLPPSNAYDKENQRQAEASSNNPRNDNDKNHHQRSSSLTPTLSRNSLGAIKKPLSAHRLKSSSSHSAQAPVVMRRHSHGSKRRVLRYGESVESLFLLNESMSVEHQRLCRDIAEGPLADDPSAWLAAVQAANKQVANDADNSNKGTDLIRLHRRATSRFSSLSQDELHKNEDAIFQLWLSYAQAQATYGSAEDARLTFRHVQNQNLGLAKASYYLKFAEFERKYDSSRAIQILKAGIEQKAEPQQALHDAIKEIQQSSKSAVKSGRGILGSSTLSPVRKAKLGSSALSPVRKPAAAAVNAKAALGSVGSSSLSPGRKPALVALTKKRETSETQETSPKRLKKNDGTPAEVAHAPHSSDRFKQPSENGHERIRPRSALNTEHKHNEKVSFAEGTASEPSRHKLLETFATKTPTRPPLANGSTRPAFGSVSVLKNSNKKPSLITKTPRLSRVGLSGKPMRVNADENPASPDSDSSMDTATQSETIDAKQLLENIPDRMDVTSTKPVPKVTKMDLSYMINWHPDSFRRPSTSPKRSPIQSPKRDRPAATATKVDCNEPKESSKEQAPPAVLAEEAQSNGSAASVVTSTLTSAHSNAGKTSHSHISMHTNRSDGSDEANHTHRATPAEPTASLDQTALLASKSNPDFLPLVSEDNILRVNKVPYVKLGVIGKGGSCKVYRALSKNCSILAIKKVKLAGMDKKAINGYANEIALLKRLRGNPAIIQMYDSEVDLARKAIFVVMELGEVDLNQVIQQQTMGSKDGDNKNRSSLDMNFIRLTWQQMLKAVHCIHDARIVHGDLKPANFLFVRGALKLIDFGIAKAIASDDTTNIYRDSQIGTLNYMSPEAILDTGSGTDGARMRIGRASDIWSLGCILYQMVYGRTPFADLHMIQKLQAIVNPSHKISFPSGVEDDGAVDAMKLCLQRNPEERPPIIGKNGLLNEHCFLNAKRRPPPS